MSKKSEESTSELKKSTTHTEESEESDNESGYVEYDVTDNPHYQVLSTVFETEEGDSLAELTKAIEKNTRSIAISLAQLSKAQVRQTSVIEHFVKLFLQSSQEGEE